MRAKWMGVAVAAVMGWCGLTGGGQVQQARAALYYLEGSYIETTSSGLRTYDYLQYFISTSSGVNSQGTFRGYKSTGYFFRDPNSPPYVQNYEHLTSDDGGLVALANGLFQFELAGNVHGLFATATEILRPDGTPFFNFEQTLVDSSGVSYLVPDLKIFIPDGDVTKARGVDGFSVVFVTQVPLPASAPLFGAALLVLGAAGYGMRRRAVPA